MGTGMQLPGNPVEQVGPHRQVAVGEVQRMHQAVALGVGKGLQEDGAGAHVHHALNQHVEVARLLGRVGVVHVVQVYVQHAHRRFGLHGDHAVGKMLAVRV